MYIIIEGIDGTGKSTQCKKISQYLENKGYIVENVVEPTDSPIGKLIRKELKNPNAMCDINQQRLSLLFAADRLTLKEKISGADCKVVLSDRSFYSSIAYQNNSTITPRWVYEINMYAAKADLVILLDVDAHIAVERCDEEETFENLEFLKKTRDNYLKLVNIDDKIKVVDASMREDDVFDEIIKLIMDKLEPVKKRIK